MLVARLRHVTKEASKLLQSYRRSDALQASLANMKRGHGQGAGNGAGQSPAAKQAKRKGESVVQEKKKRRHDVGSSMPNRSMASFFSPKVGAAATKKTAPLPGVSPPVLAATTEAVSDKEKTSEAAPLNEKRKATEPAAQVASKRPALVKAQPAAAPVLVPSIASFFGKR